MKIEKTFLGTCFLAGLSVVAAGKEGKRVVKDGSPNVVLIFMDDMGYGDPGCYGGTGYCTPNLDKMASRGMRFTNFCVSQAVCSASRASLMTGCYANRVGFAGALSPEANTGIHSGEKTMAEVMKERGYVTAAIGKWHLGHHEKFLPLQHGFDEYFGLPYSNDMWPVGYDGKPASPEQRKSRYPPLPLMEGNRRVKILETLEDQEAVTTLYTERAIEFIGKNRNRAFFLYLAHSQPHVPLAVSSKFKGKSEQGLYGDVMMEIDWSVGEILKALEKNRLTDNTLVIFTSDNGPWLNYGNHAGSAGGLREGKGGSFEGGHRVPCMMQWPGHIPEGAICNKLSSTIDILPTLAAITLATLPEHTIDGVNILPLLLGEKNACPRKIFFYYYRKNSLEAVRHGNWKLVFAHPGRTYLGFFPGKDGFPGTVQENYQFEEGLYDLRRDPGERYDVKEEYPEVVSLLKKLAGEARAELGDDLTGAPGKNRREPGTIE